MNLDKHDLFRNAAPGFVFLMVVLSFYAVTEKLENINAHQEALVALVAGFPLGFIIHSFYRLVFHIWTFGFSEQQKIEEEDGEIIRRLVGSETKAFEDSFRKCKEKEKALSTVSLLILREESTPWRERIDFLFSYVHALGSSSVSILAALGFMWWIKKWLLLEQPLRAILVSVGWSLIALIFYVGRRSIKSSCRISREVFARSKRSNLEKYFKEVRLNSGEGAKV